MYVLIQFYMSFYCFVKLLAMAVAIFCMYYMYLCSKRQQSILRQCKTYKIEISKEKHQMKIYKTMISPVVTYSSETWTLTAKDENNLCIFERQVLRKIFGPVYIDSIWRVRNKMEIDKLIEGADIVRFIKAHKIKWLGHVQRLDRARPTGKLLDREQMGTRLVGRPRQRWQEDVMEDLKKLKVKNWKETAKGRRT